MIPPSRNIDVLIIGAGPAGSSAAIRTQAAGLSTLVIEKFNFPRFRIGESLLPETNYLLKEIGVWDKMQSHGFIKKFGARFHLGYGDAEKTVVFADGLIPGLEQSYQVSRARFDALLLDHAQETGVEVMTGTTVNRVETNADGHTATFTMSATGERGTINARYIIDASGRDQFFPSELKTTLDPASQPKRIAIYSHFRGVPRNADSSGGDTVVVRLEDGWFWFIPIDDEHTSIGLVTTQAAFKAAKLSPEDHFNQVVAAQPRLHALLAPAEATMGFRVTADYSYYRREFATDRMVLAGDASGFLDPIFSSGVYLALYSSKLAAKLVIEAHQQGQRPITRRAANRYTKHLKAHAGVFHKLVDAFYSEHSFSVFMCQEPPLNLGPTITSIVAGHAHLTLPMWVRFQIFLFVCKLQRWIPFNQRISLTPPPESLSQIKSKATA